MHTDNYNHISNNFTLFQEIQRLKLIFIADFLAKHPSGNLG